MSRDAKHAASWTTEGKEAEAILELARGADASSTVDEELAAKERFLRGFRAHVEQNEAPRSWARRLQWRYALAAAATLALLVGVFKFGTAFQHEPLSYRSRSSLADARFVQADKAPIELDFSDGTMVLVRPHTRVRVTDTTRRGASFLLESGRVEFNVVPHPDRGSWVVQAGQFQVRVTGTIFSMEWVDAEGSLGVEVTRGHVVVEGAGQRRELGPGDSFHHRDPSVRPVLAPAPSASSAGEHAEQPLLLDPGVDALEPSPPHAGPAGVAASNGVKAGNWSQWVAAGEFEKVLAAAAQRGVSECLRNCAQDELWALANAARLGGNPVLAEKAFSTQRSRFAGGAESIAAAFLLGRLAEDRGDPRAVAWYDTYLKEAPTGRFAGDVLGRKMMLVAKSDPAQALPLGRAYLGRFPKGPYASHAKSLIDTASGPDGAKQRP